MKQDWSFGGGTLGGKVIKCLSLSLPKRGKRVAFTLAEVLITLGIIGIVAAMTMPTLITNYQKKQVVTKLKYVYSLMSQVLVTSQAESGEIKEWNLGTTYDTDNVKRIVHEHILPYIQYIDEGVYNDLYYVQFKNGIFVMFKLDGRSAQGEPPYVLRMKVDLRNSKKAVTTLLYSDNDWMSMNYARHTFLLDFDIRKNKLTFFNWGGDTRNGIKNTSGYKCNKDNPAYMRLNCGALIFYDGWQIKDDYPW